MSTLNSRLLSAAVLYVAIFASGLWMSLSESNRPNTLILTVHKVVVIGVMVLIGINAYNVFSTTGLTQIMWITVIATGLLFITAIATGGLLSAELDLPSYVKLIHRVVPHLTIVGSGISLYLLA